VKTSTHNFLRQTRRIVLPCVAAAALVVPVAAQAAESGTGEFSLPPGATPPAEYAPGDFSPPPGATLPLPAEYAPADFSPPPGATLPDGATPAGQVQMPSNPTAAAAVDEGFDFGDAGIAIAVVAGACALVLAAAAFLVGRRRRLGASHS
jgi:hypothetical protein